jgi:hypothetical protein
VVIPRHGTRTVPSHPTLTVYPRLKADIEGRVATHRKAGMEGLAPEAEEGGMVGILTRRSRREDSISGSRRVWGLWNSTWQCYVCVTLLDIGHRLNTMQDKSAYDLYRTGSERNSTSLTQDAPTCNPTLSVSRLAFHLSQISVSDPLPTRPTTFTHPLPHQHRH